MQVTRPLPAPLWRESNGDASAGPTGGLLRWRILADVGAPFQRLPEDPALVMSVGSASGLLEGLLPLAADQEINVVGVEVPSRVDKHLP